MVVPKVRHYRGTSRTVEFLDAYLCGSSERYFCCTQRRLNDPDNIFGCEVIAKSQAITPPYDAVDVVANDDDGDNDDFDDNDDDDDDDFYYWCWCC